MFSIRFVCLKRKTATVKQKDTDVGKSFIMKTNGNRNTYTKRSKKRRWKKLQSFPTATTWQSSQKEYLKSNVGKSPKSSVANICLVWTGQ